MKNFLTSLTIVVLLLSSSEATDSKKEAFDISKGDANIGLKLFNTKIKKSCNFINGWDFANKHSQDEWEDIATKGKFRDEIVKICSNLDDSVKESWLPNLYQFVYSNASDSGVVPWRFYM